MLEILFQSPNEIAFDLRPAEVRGDVERVLKITKYSRSNFLIQRAIFFSAKDDFFSSVNSRGFVLNFYISFLFLKTNALTNKFVSRGVKILTLDCTHKMLPTFSFLYQKRK